MANLTASRITLHPHARRGRIYHCDILLADARDGIELHEKDYPQRQYIPKADVDMSRFTVSTTVTHCPFKGESTYYSLPYIADEAWSYEHPLGEMAAIAGRLAFDSNKVTELVK
ncbi:DUF427 domain-containing protein [Halomonas caseinilytica]|uniref:Uncharacterized conserved protein, DUF427 family n=1 Tax=Halomonas caseinilytica TaxID=438744 RepID=A0A1M6V6E6_9GAMM|nr:DUF427 domain-containing protein [Halomonas caseinilytica]SHK77020.1 Uncharacterized conserved protein, DUF427 family [Halomonas caseinilytica]